MQCAANTRTGHRCPHQATSPYQKFRIGPDEPWLALCGVHWRQAQRRHWLDLGDRTNLAKFHIAFVEDGGSGETYAAWEAAQEGGDGV